jgi:hypothetical protein
MAIRSERMKLDNLHQLRQQDLAAALPGMLHLVEDIPRGLEDDALGAELARQPLQLDAVDLGDIGLAFQDRRQFCHLRGLCRVQFQQTHAFDQSSVSVG